jgi:hypothetical protein
VVVSVLADVPDSPFEEESLFELFEEELSPVPSEAAASPLFEPSFLPAPLEDLLSVT